MQMWYAMSIVASVHPPPPHGHRNTPVRRQCLLYCRGHTEHSLEILETNYTTPKAVRPEIHRRHGYLYTEFPGAKYVCIALNFMSLHRKKELQVALLLPNSRLWMLVLPRFMWDQLPSSIRL